MANQSLTAPSVSRGSSLPARRPAGRWREQVAGYAFMTPWLVGLVMIVGGPFLYSLYLSFTDYSILGQPSWVGADNYVEMLTRDSRFWSALRVTLVYLGLSVPLVQIVALLLATLLTGRLRGLTAYRSLLYIPSLIGGSVAIAILWRFLFQGDGLLNNLLGVVGLETDFSWIGSTSTALYTLVLLNVWQFGAAMVIYMAGLTQVPAELYEAATVDGAGPVRKFFSITLPVLSPVILFNVLMNIVAAFQSFNTAYVVSNGTGGPADSTLFFTLYLYQRGFNDFDMGYASALGWVLLLISGAVSLILFRLSRRFVFYGDE